MKRSSLSVAAVVATLALSAGLVACGGDDEEGGEASFDLTIGDSIPLTGDLADFGPPGDKAAKMAVAQINKAIKADNLDQTVRLLTEDNETSPQAAVSAARKMVADGASCIAGAWASADTLPTARSVAIPDGVLLISPASTSTEITALDDDGLVNRTPPADNLQGAALANFVERQLGGAQGNTVSVFGRNDAYGEGLTDSFSAEWENKGGTVKGPLLYDPEQPSYNSEAQQIVAGNPDAFVVVDFPETFPKVGPALVRTGKWDPAKTFTTDGLASSSFTEENVDITNGMRATAPGTPAQGAASQAFDELWNNSPPQDVQRQTFDGQNFDAVILCYLAAVAAGSTDGEDMAAELRDITAAPGTQYSWEELPDAVEALQNGDEIDYLGASGDIDMDENGDPSLGVYDQLRFTNGAIEPFGKQVPLPSIEAVTGAK